MNSSRSKVKKTDNKSLMDSPSPSKKMKKHESLKDSISSDSPYRSKLRSSKSLTIKSGQDLCRQNLKIVAKDKQPAASETSASNTIDKIALKKEEKPTSRKQGNTTETSVGRSLPSVTSKKEDEAEMTQPTGSDSATIEDEESTVTSRSPFPMIFNRVEMMTSLGKVDVDPNVHLADTVPSYFPPQQVEILDNGTKLFVHGVIPETIGPARSYQEWFKSVTSSMNERKFHVFRDFIYKKVNCASEFSNRSIWNMQWYSCTERKMKNQKTSSRKTNGTLYINTKTFPEFNFGNSKVYLMHPTKFEKIGAISPLDDYQFCHMWSVSLIKEEYYFDTSYLLFCMAKNA